MAHLLRILTYGFYMAHLGWATWGILRLYDHIGPTFGSAAPFYFVWTLTPVVVAHFGLKKWGHHRAATGVMLMGSLIVFMMTMALVRNQLMTDHIGPMAMMMYIPFPLTEVLIVALGLVLARWLAARASMSGKGLSR